MRPCAACRGFGPLIPEPCRECSGDGRVRSRRTLTVKIPAGVDDGTRVQLSEQGEVGPGGGPAGDLYVEIHVDDHPIFIRKGDDLHCTVTLPMTAAALGTTIDAADARGRPAADAAAEAGFTAAADRGAARDPSRAPSPAPRSCCTAAASRRCAAAAAATWSCGSSWRRPTRLDERQEELLRELAELRGEETPDGQVEPHHKSVFGRLRDAFGPATEPAGLRPPRGRALARRGEPERSTATRATTRGGTPDRASGEQVVLTDGARHVGAGAGSPRPARASLDAVGRSRSTARRAEMPRLVVVQAMPKGDRGELAVEMLTEVGVDVIVPWAAARSIAGLEGRAGREVAGQVAVGRPRGRQAGPPRVVPRGGRRWPRTEDVVRAAREGRRCAVVLHEAASGPLADVPVPGRGEIVIVVGPEGGITDEELAAFSAVGAEPLRLGSSVLRSSTAGVAAAAALLARTPRWR